MTAPLFSRRSHDAILRSTPNPSDEGSFATWTSGPTPAIRNSPCAEHDVSIDSHIPTVDQ